MSQFLCFVFADSAEKYDSRDVERLQKEDALVEAYLTWRVYVVDDALKMIDESLQWRKEFGVNGETSWHTFNISSVQLWISFNSVLLLL